MYLKMQELQKKIWKKNFEIFFPFFLMFFTVLKVRRPGRKTSGFRTVRILKILRTSRLDVMSGRALFQTIKLYAELLPIVQVHTYIFLEIPRGS